MDDPILETLLQIQKDIGELKGTFAEHTRLDTQKQDVINSLLNSIDAQVKATNGRVTQLEAYKNKQMGIISFISFVISALVGLFTGWFHH
jgi:hypothetical protein